MGQKKKAGQPSAREKRVYEKHNKCKLSDKSPAYIAACDQLKAALSDNCGREIHSMMIVGFSQKGPVIAREIDFEKCHPAEFPSACKAAEDALQECFLVSIKTGKGLQAMAEDALRELKGKKK